MPLIVIDGIDGTGKASQSKLLTKELRERGLIVKHLSFPRYDHGSGILVEQYLKGRFGDDPKILSPYMISPMYMIDRLASYLEDWRGNYERGEWIICDRYVSSNLIHQGSKLTGKERAEYIQWNYAVEHISLALPVPNITFLLEIPFELSANLRRQRGRSDIHEADDSYLRASRENAIELAELFRWTTIRCSDETGLLSQKKIHLKIMDKLMDIFQIPENPGYITLTEES